MIGVVAALIWDGSGKHKFLACQRPPHKARGLTWEFPGGKVEPNETPEQALVREIREELGADIAVGRHLVTAEHDYDSFHLSMRCYFCSLVSDRIDLLEHADARWLDMDTIDSVEWLPADIQVVDAIKASGLA